jgi:CDGSH-type Zn-finger protein
MSSETPALLIERDELEGKLRNNIMEVSFNKISGEKRVMNCTLNVSHLPPAKKDDPLTQKKIRKLNEEVLVVWDTKAEGFRTFRMANITEVKRLGSACWCGESDDHPICDDTHKSL